MKLRYIKEQRDRAINHLNTKTTRKRAKFDLDSDDDNEDGDRYKSVAYGERNNEEPTEPPYVYFNWSKSPINMPTGSLEFDKVLSDKLIPLDIPKNITKIILEKWVRKYYDNIPPISIVSFGDTLGYNQEFSKPDPNYKPDKSQWYIPKDDDDDDEFEY